MEQNNEKIAVNIGNYTGEKPIEVMCSYSLYRLVQRKWQMNTVTVALMMCWLKFVRLRPTLQSWKHNT